MATDQEGMTRKCGEEVYGQVLLLGISSAYVDTSKPPLKKDEKDTLNNQLDIMDFSMDTNLLSLDTYFSAYS